MAGAKRLGTGMLVIALGGLVATGLQAKDDKQPPAPPEIYRQLVECRTMSDPAARLACFDLKVGELQKAQESSELVIVGQQELREAKRGLFGFSLPQLKLFNSSKEQDSDKLETTVASARQYTYGRWRIVLPDGAVWDQIDDQTLALDPRSGDKLVITRAAFGSFRAKIGIQPSIRVRRVN